MTVPSRVISPSSRFRPGPVRHISHRKIRPVPANETLPVQDGAMRLEGYHKIVGDNWYQFQQPWSFDGRADLLSRTRFEALRGLSGEVAREGYGTELGLKVLVKAGLADEYINASYGLDTSTTLLADTQPVSPLIEARRSLLTGLKDLIREGDGFVITINDEGAIKINYHDRLTAYVAHFEGGYDLIVRNPITGDMEMVHRFADHKRNLQQYDENLGSIIGMIQFYDQALVELSAQYDVVEEDVKFSQVALSSRGRLILKKYGEGQSTVPNGTPILLHLPDGSAQRAVLFVEHVYQNSMLVPKVCYLTREGRYGVIDGEDAMHTYVRIDHEIKLDYDDLIEAPLKQVQFGWEPTRTRFLDDDALRNTPMTDDDDVSFMWREPLLQAKFSNDSGRDYPVKPGQVIITTDSRGEVHQGVFHLSWSFASMHSGDIAIEERAVFLGFDGTYIQLEIEAYKQRLDPNPMIWVGGLEDED